MNSQTQEGSSAISSRKGWGDHISEGELNLLKLAIATLEDFPVDHTNTFDRASDAWIGMEEALGNCCIAVFHHYQPEQWAGEGTAIVLLSQTHEEHYQLWVSEKGDCSDLRFVNQAPEVQRELV